MSKLIELIADDKELLAELNEIKAAEKAAGFTEGKAKGFKEGQGAPAGKTVEKEAPKPPKCFKTYDKSYKEHPKQCRTCPFAQKCKGNKKAA